VIDPAAALTASVPKVSQNPLLSDQPAATPHMALRSPQKPLIALHADWRFLVIAFIVLVALIGTVAWLLITHLNRPRHLSPQTPTFPQPAPGTPIIAYPIPPYRRQSPPHVIPPPTPRPPHQSPNTTPSFAQSDREIGP
jgi:hypothetical protein